MTSKSFAIPVVAGALGLGAAAVAQAAEPTTAELMAQINALQAKVQTLETQQTQNLTAKDVDATIASVLKDADKQSRLLAIEGFTAGYTDDHFTLRSSDGAYELNPFFQFQVRNVTNYRDSGKPNGNNDLQNGFEISRMKFGAWGHAISENLMYNFRWASGENNGGGGLSLENAYIQYKFADTMAFRIGQYKDNWTHEETVESYRQLAVDRSLMNEVLGGGNTDYVQGLALIYDQNTGGGLRAMLSFHDGANTKNTSFLDQGASGPVISTTSADFGISGRVEYAIVGSYKDYEQFSAQGNTQSLLVIGGGVDWTQDNSTNIYFHTADIQWVPQSIRGLSVYGAVVGIYADGDNVVTSGGESNFYDWGALVQAGYCLNDRWELFGRYDYTHLDEDMIAAGLENELHEFTIGANYYLKGHNAKVTVDLSWLPNGAPADVHSIDVLTTPGDKDEIVIRGQFQLLL